MLESALPHNHGVIYAKALGCEKDIAFSPYGKILAVSSSLAVQLWDLQNIEQVQVLKGHTGSVIALAFSPDGQVVASGSRDGTVRLWSTNQLQDRPQSTASHQDRVTVVEFSMDGQIIASASDDQTVWLWNTRTSKQIETLCGHKFSVSEITFSLNARAIALSSPYEIWLWNSQIIKKIQTVEECPGSDIAFSHDGKMMASTTRLYENPALHLWDTQTGEQIHRFETPPGLPLGSLLKPVFFSRDDNLVAWVFNQELHLWHIETGKKVQMFTLCYPFQIIALTFSSDSQTVAVARDTPFGFQIEHLQNIQEFKHVGTLPLPTDSSSRLPLFSSRHDHNVRPISFSPEGTSLHTDTGTFLFEWSTSGLATNPIKLAIGVDLCNPWIRYQGQDILYLPQEYR